MARNPKTDTNDQFSFFQIFMHTTRTHTGDLDGSDEAREFMDYRSREFSKAAHDSSNRDSISLAD
jgi:hypothetical protein